MLKKNRFILGRNKNEYIVEVYRHIGKDMNIARVYIPSIHIQLCIQDTGKAQYLTIRHVQTPPSDECPVIRTGSKINDQKILYLLYYSSLSFQEWFTKYVIT